jgi:N-methylhydantoinase A/oxoprolinase/acetone carboxylase beta subunit
VLDAIPGPCAADAVARRRADVGALLRLWEKGAIALARVTPSDAAHVRGDHDAWHRDAARLALGLLARQRDGAGEAAFASAEAAAEAVIARLVRLSAEALIETAVAEEGEASPGLARHPLVARALEGRAGALIDLRPAFRLPIVAVGASASTYYPAVARMLGAELVTPPHADVANAVGAVVGKVRVAAEARVTQPEEGRFLVSFPNETRRFDALDAAMAHAAAQAEAAARLEAQRAGAFEPLVHLERAVKEIETEGLVVFVEAVIRAVAIGRPRLGQPDAVSSATTPGSGLPSIHSRNAPPAVET